MNRRLATTLAAFTGLLAVAGVVGATGSPVAREPDAPDEADELEIARELVNVPKPTRPSELEVSADPPPAPPMRSYPGPGRLETTPPVRPRWPPPSDDDFDRADESQLGELTANGCDARELRGWLRVKCTIQEGRVTLLGGSAEGLILRAESPTEPGPWIESATMPLLPGDRRILQFAGVSWNYGGTDAFDVAFSECWIGTPGPHLALTTPDLSF